MCLTKALNLNGRKYTYTKKKFWKIVYFAIDLWTLNENVTSPFYINYTWKSGWNKADKVVQCKYYVDNSIHVFTTKKRALRFWEERFGLNERFKIIPVYANGKDLVSYGQNKDAAFSKVFVKKQDLQEITK